MANAPKSRACQKCAEMILRVAALFCANLCAGGKAARREVRDFKHLMADPARFELTTSAFGGHRVTPLSELGSAEQARHWRL